MTLTTRRRNLALFGGVFLVALAVGMVFPRSAPDAYDSEIMLQVTESMIHDQSVQVHRDQFGFNKPYSSYGIGMSLLMLPPYAVAEWLGGDPVSAAMDVNAFLFAGIAVACAGLALLSGLSHRGAAATALLVGVGTMLLPYTATAFSEPGVGLAIAVALVGLQATRQNQGWGPLVVGGASGFALLMRTDSLLLVCPVLVVALGWLARRRALAAAHFAIGFAPFVIVWAAYNYARYGAPWRQGYSQQTFNHPLGSGLWGLLFSPGRGLFLYAPAIVVALVALRAAWRRWPVLALVPLGCLVLRLLFYARWWSWHGGWGWGPRFLVAVMPALAVGFVEVVRTFASWSRWKQALLVAVVVLTAGIQVAGAAVRYEPDRLQRAMSRVRLDGSPRSQSAANEKFIDDQIADWRLFPVTDHVTLLSEGRHLAGKLFVPEFQPVRASALSALGLSGAVLVWLSVAGRRRGPRESAPQTKTPAAATA